jgi:hypothetical protein
VSPVVGRCSSVATMKEETKLDVHSILCSLNQNIITFEISSENSYCHMAII